MNNSTVQNPSNKEKLSKMISMLQPSNAERYEAELLRQSKLKKEQKTQFLGDIEDLKTLFSPDKIILFIKTLYDLMLDNKNCFLSGSFVFEDQNMYLFNSLLQTDVTNRSVLDLRRKAHYTATHNFFLSPEKFKKRITYEKQKQLDEIIKKR
jgi:hypothetical protein